MKGSWQQARTVEARLGFLLLGGVGVAASLLLAGLASFLAAAARDGAPPVADLLRHGAPLTPASLLRGLLRGNPTALIQAGVLALILTPALRVAATVVLFAAERDWTFVAVASAVLGMLVLGFSGVGPQLPR